MVKRIAGKNQKQLKDTWKFFFASVNLSAKKKDPEWRSESLIDEVMRASRELIVLPCMKALEK